MKRFSLSGPWTLDIPGTDFARVPASVPGSVYHDLLSAGLIPDPFYRNNEDALLPLMDNDFIYSRSFTMPEGWDACDAVLMRCNGLDTLAEIRLNGQPVGRADNMHRIWEYDVKSLLQSGENALEEEVRALKAEWEEIRLQAAASPAPASAGNGACKA